MKVAFIIPTGKRDVGGELSELLASLAASSRACQVDLDFSVTVVFNGAKVGAIDWPENLHVKKVSEEREGLVFARHRGVKENDDATYFVFLDDDVVLCSSYFEGLMEVVRESAPLATGALKPIWAQPPPDWILEKYESGSPWPNLPYLSIMEPSAGTKVIDPMYVWGANLFVSKKVLTEAGGFHPDGFPPSKYILRGDGETHVAEMLKNAGIQATFSDLLTAGHRVPAARLTIEYFIRRMLMEGISASFRHVRQHIAINIPSGLKGLESADFESLVNLVKGNTVSTNSIDLSNVESVARTLGYYWHQLSCRDNPIIVNWCRRPDYFG
jgi:hypothetical protein